jgi:hypothetical protein
MVRADRRNNVFRIDQYQGVDFKANAVRNKQQGVGAKGFFDCFERHKFISSSAIKKAANCAAFLLPENETLIKKLFLFFRNLAINTFDKEHHTVEKFLFWFGIFGQLLFAILPHKRACEWVKVTFDDRFALF